MPQPESYNNPLVDQAISQFPAVVRNPDLQQILRELMALDRRLLELCHSIDPVPPEIYTRATQELNAMLNVVDSTDNQLKLTMILKAIAQNLYSWSKSFTLLYALAQPQGKGEPK